MKIISWKSIVVHFHLARYWIGRILTVKDVFWPFNRVSRILIFSSVYCRFPVLSNKWTVPLLLFSHVNKSASSGCVIVRKYFLYLSLCSQLKSSLMMQSVNALVRWEPFTCSLYLSTYSLFSILSYKITFLH